MLLQLQNMCHAHRYILYSLQDPRKQAVLDFPFYVISDLRYSLREGIYKKGLYCNYFSNTDLHLIINVLRCKQSLRSEFHSLNLKIHAVNFQKIGVFVLKHVYKVKGKEIKFMLWAVGS